MKIQTTVWRVKMYGCEPCLLIGQGMRYTTPGREWLVYLPLRDVLHALATRDERQLFVAGR